MGPLAADPRTRVLAGQGPTPDLIAASISGKYEFSTKIATHVKFPVTFQSKGVVIFVENRIGDP